MKNKILKNKELIFKVKEKQEYAGILDKDILKVIQSLGKEKQKDVKEIRKKLHEVFTSTISAKLLNKKIVDKKSVEEILQKHISTKERFENYSVLYKKLLKGFDNEKITIFDLGAGINGLSFNYLQEINPNLHYLGIEAVEQLVELVHYYFKNQRFVNSARVVHESLFDLDKIKKYISQVKEKKIVFLFKVLDSLESVERNYSKKLILKLFNLKIDRIVVSFATSSLVSRKKFAVKRYWFENFLIKERIKKIDDFILGNERYLILEKSK